VLGLGLLAFLGMGLVATTMAQHLEVSRLKAWYTSRLEGSDRKVAAVPAEAPRVIAEGRVAAYPGAEVVVGTEVAGRIVRLQVRELQRVKQGELIAELNAADLKAGVREAEARIAEAEADIRFYTREVNRRSHLATRGSASMWELDSDTHALETAQARRASAEAQRDRLRAELEKCRIVAPIDGVVTSRVVDQGETVEAGAALVTIADLSRLRIEVEVDEFDAGRLQPAAAVTITAEGYDGRAWNGQVEEIPDVVVNRGLRPDDPGRPIDARVLLVKVALDAPGPLKLGQRVDVAIATK
jgi:RND family efflux transporter MFP subunit